MPHVDIEQGTYHESDVSICFYDGEDDVGSCYSYFCSNAGGSNDCNESRRVSSENSPAAGVRDCRICQLGVERESGGGEIELGCCCKDDLAIAHRQCAETWFKIKGDKICEICRSVARNVAGANETTEEQTEAGSSGATEATVAGGGNQSPENLSVRKGQRLLNFLLGCMVFAFFISWLFHFNV
ncbi:PREDICTED: uncharacterized protein LOC104806533 [Tarenaya hassleriana]|uniref:uncharacterized protein LOC104806533 n=1 Tax=Tarenaya hassleriana TaxID=28532 RepID=UPI00053C5C20|nr:PREDICTED: uncharacterized protein LOC104806533 [Tarenaya hassleriana]